MVSDGKKKLLLWCLAGVIPLLEILLMLVVLIGGVYRLQDTIRSALLKKDASYSKEQIEQVVNDAGTLLKIMEEDPTVFQEGMLLLDQDSVMRILKRVAEYNEEVTKVETVTYEYRVEQGLLKDLPEIDEYGLLSAAKEGDDAQKEAEEGAGLSKSQTSYSVSYPETSISASRNSIDYISRTMEEDVFYMRWQPIVTLCSLYIQANYKNWGSFNDA